MIEAKSLMLESRMTNTCSVRNDPFSGTMSNEIPLSEPMLE